MTDTYLKTIVCAHLKHPKPPTKNKYLQGVLVGFAPRKATPLQHLWTRPGNESPQVAPQRENEIPPVFTLMPASSGGHLGFELVQEVHLGGAPYILKTPPNTHKDASPWVFTVLTGVICFFTILHIFTLSQIPEFE